MASRSWESVMVVVISLAKGNQPKPPDIVALRAVPFIVEVTMSLVVGHPADGLVAKYADANTTADSPGYKSPAPNKPETECDRNLL